MTTINDAIRAHKSGDFNKADKLYRKAIDRGDNITSLAHAKQMLGVLRFQTGHSEDARRLIRQSIAINPKDDAAHYHYGVVLASLKLHEDAVIAFGMAISFNASNVGAYNNRGVALHALGEHEKALDDFSKAIELQPDMVEAFYNSGNAYKELGKFEEALTAFDCAIEREPNYAHAHLNRGNTLRQLGRLDDAIAAYDKAIEIGKLVEAHVARGNVLLDQKKLDEARASYRAAVDRDPKAIDGWIGLGNASLAMGHETRTALRHYEQAVAINPKSIDALMGCGNALAELGLDADAIEKFDKALALAPGRADLEYNKSFPVLATGNYAEGWKLYGRRWDTKGFASQARFPMGDGSGIWRGEERGEDLTGKTIVVWSEQGFGDTIQIARFLPVLSLRELDCKVVFEVQRPLAPLFSPVFPNVIAKGDPLPPFAYHCPLMSLPLALGMTSEDVPAAPYIKPDSRKAADWALWLGERKEGRPRVGLAWAGNPGFRADVDRSLPLKALTPLFADATGGQIRWISLQKDVRERDAADLAALPLQDFAGQITDFADTAALISQLDAVVTTDNGVAHLAGAMGKPVFLILQKYQDWRWLRDRDDSPWYPSMKIFRAGSIEALPTTLVRVSEEIAKL